MKRALIIAVMMLSLGLAACAVDSKTTKKDLSDQASAAVSVVLRVSFEARLVSGPGEKGVVVPGWNGESHRVKATSILDARHLRKVMLVVGEDHSEAVNLSLTAEGTTRLAQASRRHRDRFLAILVDGTVAAAPRIRAPILGGRVR